MSTMKLRTFKITFDTKNFVAQWLLRKKRPTDIKALWCFSVLHSFVIVHCSVPAMAFVAPSRCYLQKESFATLTRKNREPGTKSRLPFKMKLIFVVRLRPRQVRFGSQGTARASLPEASGWPPWTSTRLVPGEARNTIHPTHPVIGAISALLGFPNP